MKIMVTGGAGFIGSAIIRRIISRTAHHVINVDKLTYASNLDSISAVVNDSRYFFEKVDIVNAEEVRRVIQLHKPDAILHLAAESHVDRSINGPEAFIQTNIIGTYNLLQEALQYYRSLSEENKKFFRFQHISTDEVFGSLGPHGAFTEETPYDPSSPYSASKASSDHLVRAWGRTFDLPVLITNCSNNYGPYQFPEKLIPLMILKGLNGESLPVYGTGENIRDWLYVDDHAEALLLVLEKGKVGRSYNIGGLSEEKNIDVVYKICDLLDSLRPITKSRRSLIKFVVDRPGHDARYAMDINRIKDELGWKPKESFSSGIEKTIKWYLENTDWWQKIQTSYGGERLGVISKV